ncbi:FAD-dependent oxidoreductase [Pedobacter nutrimenti]|uniref:FAD-dependent oxidoreductase n=1 Tax=Pedobacter nutrimenti TaxID=1241337 RepID=UPI002930A14F|nr:FAD-dependent oxidoreductase [Pedobacter nutrimenti]
MLNAESTYQRNFINTTLNADLTVIGGGLSGVCCAITAARAGLKVTLVQDRSVLGGNASSEVRLWILGATSHMGNNNRWAREGGVIDEILVENTYRNPEGNPVIFDAILLDKVSSEPNITLLLNTAVYETTKQDASTIKLIKAFCSQNQTTYLLKSPLFCDASGDGVVGFLAGAAFRMGAEDKLEFGELFAPDQSYGELLGHSLYFYTKDTGKAVKFVPPSFALDDITKIPRFKSFNSKEYGCKLWWIEYGGRKDTVHDTEDIKWELWKIVYGVWNHIKNSGLFPDAENLTLEWVGMIPGKRESRRFEGDYMLIQQDIIEQHQHKDAVAFGGWSVDLHPSDGIYSALPGCNQWHSKGIYQIPYRCLYSKNISNLFLAGRIISTSHVAFGSTRVMATSAYVGQAVAMAASICKTENCLPADVTEEPKIKYLQQKLIASGQYIPDIRAREESDLVQQSEVTASSELRLTEMPGAGDLQLLDIAVAQMLPFKAGILPEIHFKAFAETATTLETEIRISSKLGNYTPDETIAHFDFDLQVGENQITLPLNSSITEDQYIFILIHKNPVVKIQRTDRRITGILSLFNTVNPAVSNFGKQEAPEGIGMDSFEFWCPQRRPGGQNIAMRLDGAIEAFCATNIKNGIARPTTSVNAWVADIDDQLPSLKINWSEKKKIKRLVLSFDSDFDHPMESVLMTHPENIMPFCVRNYRVYDEAGHLLYKKTGNHQTRNEIIFEDSVYTSSIRIEVEHPSEQTPASIFEIRAYEN